MTKEQTIAVIRDQVSRLVNDSGASVISVESLERLLTYLSADKSDEDIAAAIEAGKETALAQQRADLAQFSAEADARLELFRSVISSGQAALKSFFLLNGGAAVAVLALVGHLSTTGATAAHVDAFALPLLCFAVGLLLSAIASGGTYYVQKAYSDRRKQLGDRLNAVGFVVCIASLLAFVAGGYYAYVAIHGIAAGTPCT
jgi:hypothetical protein